jgi:hypothetical protein
MDEFPSVSGPRRLVRRAVVPAPVSCREGADLDELVHEDPVPAPDSGAIDAGAGSRQRDRPAHPNINAVSGGRPPDRPIVGLDRGGSIACPNGGTVREAVRWMRPRHRRGVFTKRLRVIAAHGANPPRILQGVRCTLVGSASTAGTSDKPVPAGKQTPDVVVGKDRR